MIRTASFLERVFVVLAAAASPSAAQMNLKNCGFNRKDSLPFRMTFFVNFQCSGPAQFLRKVWSKYSRDPPSARRVGCDEDVETRRLELQGVEGRGFEHQRQNINLGGRGDLGLWSRFEQVINTAPRVERRRPTSRPSLGGL